ncbi:MAG: FG-GAP repeat protein [Calditrichaceae bacterium]|nr:FG-GAP-like repeat-containing protein [Calditrichia bacterium]NUQ40509.1 FG-GAP repeat protein [Calditrichaceae bacterium]
MKKQMFRVAAFLMLLHLFRFSGDTLSAREGITNPPGLLPDPVLLKRAIEKGEITIEQLHAKTETGEIDRHILDKIARDYPRPKLKGTEKAGHAETANGYLKAPGEYATAAAELSLIQTFPALPPSGRNGSYLGEEVANIGDVNGDGYDDWALGIKDAAIYQTGQKVGKVYIYFGGGALLNEKDPDLILTGEAEGDYFGYSVAGAGDVNNDGYSDVLVGAYSENLKGYDIGRAYIYWGGPAMDNIADIIFSGEASLDYFGYSVSGAGDVNNDGFADVIIGAYGNETSGSFTGRAYLYFGGVNMNSIPDVVFTGESAYTYFGYSVAAAGDVNNDGFSDVIVGTEWNAAGAIEAGRAYLYLGGTNMNNVADVIFTGEASWDRFGYSVSGAGDVNNDGFADVIVGAVKNDAAGLDAGRAYLYFGGANLDNIADLIFTGEAGSDYFGVAVSGAGDVNNDGFSDVLIGASWNDAGGVDAGRAYLYFGGPGMDNIADVIFTGEAGFDLFGHSVSAAGDVNNDGFADVIIGALWNDAGGQDAGRAYLYFGGTGMNNIADVILSGEAGNERFGVSVASAGDVNNDGFSDVIVGAYLNDAGGEDAGCAYLYFGGPGMDNIPDAIFTGEASGDCFGYSVAGAGDVNNDGFSDVIVGAYRNDAGGFDAGRAYLYFGGPGMDNIPEAIFTGEAGVDYFGNSVSSAGDVNNDGFPDVIVGAYLSDAGGLDAGHAYLYFGGVLMDNIPDVIFTGEAGFDYFGNSVSAAGDVNNDGFADVIIGAYANDAGEFDAGRAYLYFGGASMDNIPDVIFTGEAVFDYFGNSVSAAGDVNNDGFSDVIVGAYLNSASGIDAGRAYLYFGGANMDNIADVIFNGEADYDYFGNSVSAAGDVNNDGFSDVIVGAYANKANGVFAGRAYLYLGGPGMDNIADALFTGQAIHGYFGNSVSSAGDVNNDGFSDLIIGAEGNSAVGYQMGRAYVYAGSAISTGIEDRENAIAGGCQLFQNYPNPFNPTTSIRFSLPRREHVTLKIFDLLGRKVATPVEGNLEPGEHSVVFDGSGLSSGVYFYRLEAGSFVGQKKLILVR